MKNKLQFSKVLLMLFLVISFQKSFAQANEPTNLVATVGVNSVSVAFTTPTTVVGGAITNYEYSLDNGSSWVAMSPVQSISPLKIKGLTNCTDYSIKIRAVNISGAGTASSAVTVTPQNGQQPGVKWTFRNLQVNNYWVAATYGNGLFVSVGLNSGTVMTSPDGITWTSRTLTNSNRWNSVTYGNGLFVAVGDNGNSTGSATDFVMTSPDGITWTSRTPSSSISWNSVTYGNGLFVAVGYGKVMKSTDGITWTNSTAPENNWVNCTYGNGLFVAVANIGSGGRVMTSSDGITWTSRTAAANIYWSSVIYGNGLFVAVANYGTGNRLMTSPDGINWTLRASADDSQDWKSVIYGNGQFVAVSYSTNDLNQVMTSPDGINWTIQTVTRNYQWQSITYGNGLYLVVSASGTMTSSDAFAPDIPTINAITPSGFYSSVSFSEPASSGFSAITNYEYSLDNGSNWVTPSPAVTTSPLRIGGLSSGTTYPIQLRAVNTTGASCASATVSTTTLVPIVPNEPTNVVATAGLNAVSIEFTVPTNDGGADITNYEYTINDGLSWTALTSITSPLNISGLTGCTNYTIKIRAVNAIGGGATSTPITVTPQNGQAADSITWTSRTAIQDNYWSSITYGNGQFVVVSGSGGGVMTSPNAITWTSRTAIQGSWYSVTYGNGQFVAVGSGGVMTSPDGITWNSRIEAPQDYWSSITYGNGLFVAVGGSSVMTSPDGITWTSRTAPENTWFNSVTYGNGQFVAVGGYSGMTSPDGITWTSSNVQSYLSSVTFGNGLFVAAGFNELVTSPDGIIWTSIISSNDFLNSVTYGNGLFVVTMNNSVKTSLDGITWTDRAAVQGNWSSITYGNGQFVAVSGDGVMTNSATISPSQPVINSITPTINSASLVFSAPENSGTSAISNYEYSLDNGSTWITPSPAIITSPILISGLESNTNYPIQLRAVNDAGFSCASLMVNVRTLSLAPPAPPASAQTFCGSKTVADLVATGTNLKWYDVATNGTALELTTAIASGTYYVSQTDNGCESARTSVEVTINNSVAGIVPAGQLIVRGTKPTAISLTGSVGTVQWQISLNNSTFKNIVGATSSTLTSDQMGVLTSKKFYRAVLNTSCNSATSEVIQVWTTLATKIQDSQCGKTLASLTTIVSANSVPGANKYRFKVVNGTTTKTIETTSRGFSLTALGEGALLNTTYTISVATQSIGLWSDYGTECTVTTPSGITKIQNSQCGQTLASLSTNVMADAVAGVTNYRFKVVQGETTRFLETTARSFNLKSLDGGVLYNTTYTVSVATKYNNVWSDYGTECTVTTPSGLTKIKDSQCGTTLASLSTKVVANAVVGVSNYSFKVVNGGTTRTIVTVAGAFSLKSLEGGALNGTTYTVSVATKYNGTWGEYGTECTVTTPSIIVPSVSRQAATASVKEDVSDAVSVLAYPNPFKTTFKLDFNSSSEANVAVFVYDMIGRLIENKEVIISEINNLELGNGYPSGVYNAIITQGTEVKTLRVIKE